MIKRMITVFLILLIIGGLLLGISVRLANGVEIKNAFLDAVDNGDLRKVEELLANDPKLISIKDGKGKGGIGSSVLHIAVRHGHKDIVELLLSKGANPNEKSFGQTPLHKAALRGDAELIELLIKYGADVNAVAGEFLHTPLCFAKSREAAEVLITNDADLAWRDKYDRTILHSIARLGAIEAAEVILEHGADVNAKGKAGLTPLYMAIAHDQKEMVELLIAKGADIEAVDKRGFTPLMRAMERTTVGTEPRKDIAKLLISCGAKYTITDVVWLGDLPRVRELLEANPALVNSISVPEREPVLFSAIRSGHSKLVELLLAKGANLDIRGAYEETALHAAAHAGHRTVVELLLEKGMDVDQKGPYGELALHWAAAKGHIAVAQALISAGSKVNTKTDKQRVDMDVMMKEDADVVKHQLKYLELREKQRQARLAGGYLQICVPARLAFAAGDTPLHSATQWGREEIVKMLLENGAEVNTENHQGQIALHYACIFRNKEIAEMLLGAGADANAKNDDGHTPLGLALSPKGAPAKDIIELLLTKGAHK